MTTEENNNSNQLPNKEFDEKKEKTLENLIKYEKERCKKMDGRIRFKEDARRNDEQE